MCSPLRELPAIPADLVDQFVKSPMTAEAAQDLSMVFKKALIERALRVELGPKNRQFNADAGWVARAQVRMRKQLPAARHPSPPTLKS